MTAQMNEILMHSLLVIWLEQGLLWYGTIKEPGQVSHGSTHTHTKSDTKKKHMNTRCKSLNKCTHTLSGVHWHCNSRMENCAINHFSCTQTHTSRWAVCIFTTPLSIVTLPYLHIPLRHTGMISVSLSLSLSHTHTHTQTVGCRV